MKHSQLFQAKLRGEPLTADEIDYFNHLKTLDLKRLVKLLPAWARTKKVERAAEFIAGQKPHYPGWTAAKAMAATEFKFPSPHLTDAAEYIAEFKRLNGPYKNPRALLYTIGKSDIGRSRITARGKRWNIADVMGAIQAIDVGKRIYDMGDGVLQVENDQQRDARIGGGSIKLVQNPRHIDRYCVTRMEGKTLRCFPTKKAAIQYARKTARLLNVQLRIVDSQ